MPHDPTTPPYSATPPVLPKERSVVKRPRKPDWLLILVSVLLILTLLIARLVDMPTL